MEQKINLEELFDSIDEATGSDKGTTIKTFSAFLALPDEKFEVVKDSMLMELERGFNNINDKLALAQAFNVSNMRVEDIAVSFEQIAQSLKVEMTEKFGTMKADFMIEVLSIIFNSVADSEAIAHRIIQIPIEICSEDAKIPEYAHISDAGMDVYSPKDYNIGPGEQIIIPLDLKFAIPEGYAILVQPRSGLSAKTKLRICNTPGLIDSHYRGNVGVIIENIEPRIKDIEYEFIDGKPVIRSILHGQSYGITKGDRIAQIRLVETPKISFYQVDKVPDTDRGEGGFGSTGK